MKTTRAEVETGVEELLSGVGFELVQLEWGGDPKRPVLRVRIERAALDRPVSLDDCTAMSREIEARLDEGDLVPDSYVLEVSSPGLERPLTRGRDFRRFRGRRVVLFGEEPLWEGSRRLEGELLGYAAQPDDSVIRMRLPQGDEVEIRRASLASARLVHEWPS